MTGTSAKYTAFYARRTREDPENESSSVENQCSRFKELQAKQGWAGRIFAEKGRHRSGEWSTDKRPALKDLLDEIKKGNVERLVVRDLDRLGRGPILMLICEDLAKANVELWDFSGNVEYRTAAGELGLAVQASVGRFEVRRTGERIRESKRAYWKKGIHIGPAPFGYTSQSRIYRELVEQGVNKAEAKAKAHQEMPEAPGIRIEPDEARVVRMIFEMYVNEELGTKRVAQNLNSRGLLKRGRNWTQQAVRKILVDPKMAGWATFDDESYQARQRNCQKPIHKQQRLDAAHEAIVDRNIWQRAQRTLEDRGKQVHANRSKGRIYPLTGAIQCINGHRMKGKASGSGKLAYYTCHKRSDVGSDPDSGGCNAHRINVNRAESAVLEVLDQILSSPEKVVEVYEATKRRMQKEAPVRKRELAALDRKVARLEKEREGVFQAFRNPDLSPDQHTVIADRVAELNLKIRDMQDKRTQLESKVVLIRVPKMNYHDVAAYMNAIKKELEASPRRFKKLITLLRHHHDLKITVLDSYRVRVSMNFSPEGMDAKTITAKVQPSFPFTIEEEGGARPLTNEEWAARENEKGHYCQCGCGQKITVLPRHRASTVGIPKFIRGSGHWKCDMTGFVEQLNREGYLTIGQVAKELGIGETTLRRYEKRGVIMPEYREWGKRWPMRVYGKEDLGKLKKAMEKAGFRYSTP